jgi:RNA polymerase sigma factor for flagellar operon FliA
MSKASAQPRSGARKAPAAAEPVQATKTAPRKAAAKPRASARRAAPAPETMPLDTPEAIDAAWRCYVGLPADTVSRQALRNRLIERYLDVVRFTAERLHKRLPSEVDVEDLHSAGLFGLMDAIDAFDPERGVKFETYCAQRIRGAIFDELRAMDWVPRLVRSRTAKVERVRKAIEMEQGQKPTDAEVAKRLNVAPDEYEKLSRDSRPVSVVSMHRKWNDADSGKEGREVDVIEDARQDRPLDRLHRNDVQALLTKGLSRAERLILILYYYEEMTMKEIGLTLDLSESRVSQMHSSIIMRLKAQMKHRIKEL